jgi:hypothetical protein
VRLGLRDQEQTQLYMRVTVLTESRWRTCESSGAQEDLADDRSRTAVTRVEWRGTRMEYATRGRFDGLGLKTIGWTGLRVWTSKPGRRFRGGTDGTWRHRGVRVEVKLSHEGCGGRRMKITLGWTITPSGHVVRLKISKGKTRIV